MYNTTHHFFECAVELVTCRSSISRIQQREYVTAMETDKQSIMAYRELKLAIGDELQTLFHPIIHGTKQAAQETRKELEPMKKTLTDIDGALTAQRVDARPQQDKSVDTTFGVYRRQNGQLVMGSKIVQVDLNKKTLTVDGTVYDFTPGLRQLIVRKKRHPSHWTSRNYQEYKSLCAQTKVRSRPNPPPEGATRPQATWKYKHMLRKMVMPGERIVVEESEDSEGTDTASVGDIVDPSETASVEGIDESSDSGIQRRRSSVPPRRNKRTRKEIEVISRRVLCR